MPVYKDDQRGTWYYSFKQKDPLTGSWKTIKKRGFKTKRDASAAEREAMSAGSVTSSTAFSALVPLWEAHTQASAIVRQKHKEHFDIRFSDYYDMPVEQLTKPVLSRFRANLAMDDRFSTATKNVTLSYVKAVLRFGNSIYDLPDNSSVLTRLRESDQEAMQEFDVWTPEEFSQFIKAVEIPIYAIYFRFLYWTGCRRGEAIALQKDQIGDHTATIKYSQRSQKAGLRPTKTRLQRTIKLDDILFDQLKPLLREPGNYVFGGESGLSPFMIDDQFRKAIEKSGVKRIRLHDLRHSHATWLINNGVNIVAVSKRLGHTDVSTTLNTYTHLLESTDNDMIRKLNEFKKR